MLLELPGVAWPSPFFKLPQRWNQMDYQVTESGSAEPGVPSNSPTQRKTALFILNMIRTKPGNSPGTIVGASK